MAREEQRARAAERLQEAEAALQAAEDAAEDAAGAWARVAEAAAVVRGEDRLEARRRAFYAGG